MHRRNAMFGRLAPALAVGLGLVACSGGDAPSRPGPSPSPPGEASIDIRVTTSGQDLDLDGYLVGVAGTDLRRADLEDTVLLTVPPGTHEVTLTDAAGNCTDEAPFARSVTLAPGERATVEFAVHCRAIPPLSGAVVVALWDWETRGSSASFPMGLFVLDPESGDTTRLTESLERPNQPAVSPDGKRIAVNRASGLSTSIHIVHADGSEEPGPIPLATAQAQQPTWSPDGRRIAFFATGVDGLPDIFVIGVDGTGLRNLTESVHPETGPAWASDGSEIVFRSGILGPGLHAVSPAGTGLRRVTSPAEGEDFNADWSPDGSRIAFDSNRTGAFRIYVVDAEGGEPSQLTSGSGFDDFGPRWAPDGSRLVFKRVPVADGQPRDDTNDPDLWLVRPDGTGLRQLTESPGLEEHAHDWSP